MKDIKGNELAVGDEVVYACKHCGDVCLEVGFITKIYANDKECSVGSMSHVRSHRILKLGYGGYFYNDNNR